MEHEIKEIEKSISLTINPDEFSEILYQKMQIVDPTIRDMELFEFRYALENLIPKGGWDSIQLSPVCEIEEKYNSRKFYESIKLRPEIDGKLVFDDQLTQMTQMLFFGIVDNTYSVDWIKKNFYFDARAFFFYHRTNYYNPKIINRLGGSPYRIFEMGQEKLKNKFDVGYQDFKNANEKVDQFFVDLLFKIISQTQRPCIIGIAGQTAAGKTEIVARLQEEFTKHNISFTSLEMDHFLTDRNEREEKGIDSLGKEALHFELFKESLKLIREGFKVIIPQYDFISATSSHTQEGKLKPDRSIGELSPADVIFVEGNFPFLYEEIADLIDLKAIYLTDDEIRLKRKWKRDMDYRKKYELKYFLNRFFREQFLMAESAYIPQMEKCDLLVDTTKAEVWLTSEMISLL